MPLYFIDTDDDDVLMIDEEGVELADDAAARYQALAALPDMAKDKMPDGDRRTFRVGARNEAGDIVYSAEMRLQGDPTAKHWSSGN